MTERKAQTGKYTTQKLFVKSKTVVPKTPFTIKEAFKSVTNEVNKKHAKKMKASKCLKELAAFTNS